MTFCSDDPDEAGKQSGILDNENAWLQGVGLRLVAAIKDEDGARACACVVCVVCVSQQCGCDCDLVNRS